MSDEPQEVYDAEEHGLQSDPTSVPEHSILCDACNQSVPSSHRFCGHCGASLVRSTTGNKQWTLSVLDVEGDIESVAALIPGTQIIGSAAEADIMIQGDRAVSPRHVLVRLLDGELSLEDKGTRNGLFTPLTKASQIAHNALIRAGGQLFRFQLIERLGVEPVVPLPHPSFGPAMRVWGRLLRYNRHGQVAAARLLDQPIYRVGRRLGDWQIVRARTMSGEHFEIRRDSEGMVTISDLSSRNGTFVQVSGAVQIEDKNSFLIGDRLVRLDQVTLAEYHETIGSAEGLQIDEVESIDEAEIQEEETFVAIPEEVVEAALEDSIPPIFADQGNGLRAAPSSEAPAQEETVVSNSSDEATELEIEARPTEAAGPQEPNDAVKEAPVGAVESSTPSLAEHPTEFDEALSTENEGQVKTIPEPSIEAPVAASSGPNDLSDYATEIDDEEPGEWAKAALSDFQDLD